MDVVERLTLEAAQQDTMLAREHRHRYEFAAGLCAGLRVVDLCCGSGYGSALLAPSAAHVLGVDIDAATIETAVATVGAEQANVEFRLGDAVAVLRGLATENVDAVVCFEGLEHVAELAAALDRLRELAELGIRLIVSVPNSRMFDEDNPFHLTNFGYDEARRAFETLPGAVIVPQFLAEGSLICPPGAVETEFVAELSGYDEPEYANHFICCVGFDDGAVRRATHGNLQLSASPLFNRWAEGMKQAVRTLRRENARLARGRLGKSGSAAASALATIEAREQRVGDLEARCRLAEARVGELERGGNGPPPSEGPAAELIPVDTVEAPLPAAAQVSAVAAWVESTIPLDGRTLSTSESDSPLASELGARGARVVDAGAEVILLEGVSDPDALAQARELVAEDGAIVVCGAPNRLAWGSAGGLSFAEFEAVFDDLPRHVIGAGHDIRLLGCRPVQPEEIALARHLDRVRPDLPSAFARRHIDLVLAASPLERRPPWMRAWTAETTTSPGAAWTRAETIRIRLGGKLRVELPAPSARLLLGLVPRQDHPFELTLRPTGAPRSLAVRVAATRDRQVFLEIPLPAPAREIAIEAGGLCEVVLVAYES